MRVTVETGAQLAPQIKSHLCWGRPEIAAVSSLEHVRY